MKKNLTKIFRYLCVYGSVCKRFAVLNQASSPWQILII